MSERKKMERAPRYDKAEDRDDDIKTHDNPNHPSKHAQDKAEAEAEQQLADQEEQDYE
jgi:hypothetical protein